MSEIIVFSREDLERIRKDRLLKLAQYYGWDVKSNWTKDEIIEDFLDRFAKLKAKEEEVPTMSVRLRRIREQNLGSV